MRNAFGQMRCEEVRVCASSIKLPCGKKKEGKKAILCEKLQAFNINISDVYI